MSVGSNNMTVYDTKGNGLKKDLDPRASINSKITLVKEVLELPPQKTSRDFAFYWSKKSSHVAKAIYDIFAKDGSVVLDPFLGSGSALSAIRDSSKTLKFIGIDINELPIQTSRFNMTHLSKLDVEGLRHHLNEFKRHNQNHYEYEVSNTKVQFKSAKVDFVDGVLVPNEISLISGSKTLVFNSNQGNLFEDLKVSYMERQQRYKAINATIANKQLTKNSRIAVKQGMLLSDIFSPLTFNILSNFRDSFSENLNMSILLSSCLHLCRLTDTKAQSQFPYWVPKRNAIDRNIFHLLESKITLLEKQLTSKLNYTSQSSIEEAIDFEELLRKQNTSFLLFHSPIQDINSDKLPDNSVDMVFTDPPYFDQVAYSEYLVIWEFFTSFSTNFEKEVVESGRSEFTKSRSEYLKTLEFAFQKISIKLKNDGLAIVYFKDSKLANIRDFLVVLDNVGLKFEAQFHLPKPKFTYKQNTSKLGTVEGDSIYVFRKTKNRSRRLSNSIDQKSIEQSVIKIVEDYLREMGEATVSKIMDAHLIPELWENGMLMLLDDSFDLIDFIDRNFHVSPETRIVSGPK